MIYVLQQTLNALQIGSLYALVALGYTMVYGVLSLINFAHGDLFMVGAFVAFFAASLLGLTFLPALLISMLAVALLAVLIERLAYRPLRRAPKMSVVITALSVGIFLEHAVLAFNPYPRHVPPLFANVSWSLGGLTVSSAQVLILGCSIVLMIALDLLVTRTRWGMAMRAISFNAAVAPLMGVPVNRVISVTFALGGALGATAGVLFAAAYPVIDPYMGVLLGWKAFISAVIGGIGNLRGAMLGGLLLGIVETSVAATLPSTWRDLVVFILLLTILMVRPHGLLGKPRLEKV